MCVRPILAYYCLLTLTLSTPLEAQQPLPNGGLEAWRTEGAYEQPEPGSFWATLNPVSALLPGTVTVTKVTDAHSGNYAARLQTKAIGTLMIPGLLNSGTFNSANLFSPLEQGRPFTDRPQAFRGWYKYAPVNNDSAVVFAQLTRYTPTGRVLVAEAKTAITTPASVYTAFDLPFVYYTTDAPDTINIVLGSSVEAQNGGGAVGSTLWIDDLSLSYAPVTRHPEVVNSPSPECFFNPSANTLCWYHLPTQNRALHCTLFNNVGQVVLQHHLPNGSATAQIYLPQLPHGIYYYYLSSEGQYWQGSLYIAQ